MSDISTEKLCEEIDEILKKADLSVLSVKKVREQLEKKLNCSLLSRKKEVDKIVMDLINEKQEQEEAEESASEPEEEEKEEEPPSSEEEYNKKPKKRQQQVRKAAPPPKKKKKKALNASDSGTESDDGNDSDYKVPKKAPQKKKAGAAGGGGGTARKSTGFTRAYTLSPELSALMGSESLPRHEVVKKVWAIIKERNLYDPKNKQFAICDEDLLKVMKVKRFRTFGMLKLLKPHFLD